MSQYNIFRDELRSITIHDPSHCQKGRFDVLESGQAAQANNHFRRTRAPKPAFGMDEANEQRSCPRWTKRRCPNEAADDDRERLSSSTTHCAQPHVKHPRFTGTVRSLLVLLASQIRTSKDALLIVKPDTRLRWHRQGFRLFWKRKSHSRVRATRIPAATITLIKEMAAGNHLWGVKRIQGELLKLDIRVSKRTIQRYIRQVRPPRPHRQTWATFLHNHAKDIWACDFLQLHDAFFRPLFAFFINELGSRRIVHVVPLGSADVGYSAS